MANGRTLSHYPCLQTIVAGRPLSQAVLQGVPKCQKVVRITLPLDIYWSYIYATHFCKKNDFWGIFLAWPPVSSFWPFKRVKRLQIASKYNLVLYICNPFLQQQKKDFWGILLAVSSFWPFKRVKQFQNASKNMIFKNWLDTRPKMLNA